MLKSYYQKVYNEKKNIKHFGWQTFSLYDSFNPSYVGDDFSRGQ